jgi:excisionase family DNA binding protein
MQAMHPAVPPQTERRPLLTTGAAAAVASCHRTTILRAIQAGELEAVRLGQHGDHRIPVDALERWLTPAGPNQETP